MRRPLCQRVVEMEELNSLTEQDVETERREEPRNRERKQITVRAEINGMPKSLPAWLFNASETGVCFRCREEIGDDATVYIELDAGLTVGADVMWGKEVVEGVFEYGARLIPESTFTDDQRAEIPEEDIYELTAEPEAHEETEPEAESTVEEPPLTVTADEPKALRRKSKLKRLVFLGLLACGIAFAWTKFADTNADESPTAEPNSDKLAPTASSPKIITPLLRDLPANAGWTGRLVPYQEHIVRTRMNGFVASVSHNAGDTVIAGQAIVDLDNTHLIAAVDRAEAAVGVARAQLQITTSELAPAKTILEKYKAGLKLGAFTQPQVDEARSQVELLKSRETLARRNLIASETTLLARLGELKRARLASRITGVVAERFVQPGERVRAGESLLRVVDHTRVRLEVTVPENAFVTIEIGTTLPVRLDAFAADKFEGNVVQIAPELHSESKTGRVVIEIVNSDGRLKPGLTAKVLSDSNGSRQGLFVPKSVVRSDANRSYVLIVTTESPQGERREVETGRVDGKLVEIRHGLAVSDRVVGTE